MRYIYTILLFSLFSATLQADQEIAKSNLFECVDDSSLSIDQSCISNSVTTNFEIHSDLQFSQMGNNLGENVLATMRFYPEKMLIEVVAHTEQQEQSMLSKVDY